MSQVSTSDPAATPDRRADRRYPLAAKLRYQLWDGASLVGHGQGVLVNMSSRGALFRSQRPPTATASLITMWINWPATWDRTNALTLILTGRIVRVNGELTGVSIRGKEFRSSGRVPEKAASRRSPIDAPSQSADASAGCLSTASSDDA